VLKTGEVTSGFDFGLEKRVFDKLDQMVAENIIVPMEELLLFGRTFGRTFR
jgi:hypothetical protein